MPVLLQCTRCDHSQTLPFEKNNLGQFLFTFPKEWDIIRGKEICHKCSTSLDDFLKPLPQAAESMLLKPVL